MTSRPRWRNRTVTDNSSQPNGVTRGHLPAGSAVSLLLGFWLIVNSIYYIVT